MLASAFAIVEALTYFAGYPEDLQARVPELFAKGRLGAMLERLPPVGV